MCRNRKGWGNGAINIFRERQESRDVSGKLCICSATHPPSFLQTQQCLSDSLPSGKSEDLCNSDRSFSRCNGAWVQSWQRKR